MLYKSDGNILEAIRRLMHNDLNFPIWTKEEITCFEQLIVQHGKKFDLVSKDLKTKTVKECVEFYYRWKKTPHRSPPRSNATDNNNNLNNTTANIPQVADVFPCKVCGRIFEKIKSRSAHMKRHKNEVSNSGYAYDQFSI